MNEFLEVKKEASVCVTAERAVRTAGEHPVRKSRQAVVKHAHPSSSAGGSSRKKTRREPTEAEVLLQGVSEPGLGSAESEKEEEVAPPLIQSRCSRGLATLEGTEVVEGPQPEAPLALLTTSGEGAEVQPGSPSIMMLALKVVESSPTTGPIGGKAPAAEVPLVQVSSSSSEGDDHDVGPEPASHDASETLHMTEQETQVIPSETELLAKEIATAESIFSFPPMSFPIENVDDVLIICLSNLLHGLPLQLKAKPP